MCLVVDIEDTDLRGQVVSSCRTWSRTFRRARWTPVKDAGGGGGHAALRVEGGRGAVQLVSVRCGAGEFMPWLLVRICAADGGVSELGDVRSVEDDARHSAISARNVCSRSA